MTALAYVTVDTPQRRIDLALPAQMPIAEMLPLLVSHGGGGLAERGRAPGGWLLRRLDGEPLRPSDNLDDQGVRDGDVLCLTPADRHWPALAYDDVAVAVAESPDRGRRWDPDASRHATGAAVVSAALLGAAAAHSSPLPSMAWLLGALVVAVVVTVAALARLAHDQLTAAYVAVGGVPIVLASGYLLAGRGPAGLAGAGLASFAYAAFVVGARGRVGLAPIVAAVVGLMATPAAVIWADTSATATAAATLAASALAGAAAPSIGVRLGGLPVPRLLAAPDQVTGAPPLRPERLAVAVARTDNVILGLQAGVAATALAASTVLAQRARWPELALAGAAAVAFALRARARVLTTHRAAGLAAAACAAIPPMVVIGASHGVTPIALAAIAPFAAVGVSVTIRRGGSPYVARLAEVAEMAAFAALVPLACACAGLFRPFIGG